MDSPGCVLLAVAASVLAVQSLADRDTDAERARMAMSKIVKAAASILLGPSDGSAMHLLRTVLGDAAEAASWAELDGLCAEGAAGEIDRAVAEAEREEGASAAPSLEQKQAETATGSVLQTQSSEAQGSDLELLRAAAAARAQLQLMKAGRAYGISSDEMILREQMEGAQLPRFAGGRVQPEPLLWKLVQAWGGAFGATA